MTPANPLYRVTITGWLPYNPDQMELRDIAYQMEQGEGICTGQESERIDDPCHHPDWLTVADFFSAIDLQCFRDEHDGYDPDGYSETGEYQARDDFN